jgi:hypothetical protein
MDVRLGPGPEDGIDMAEFAATIISACPSVCEVMVTRCDPDIDMARLFERDGGCISLVWESLTLPLTRDLWHESVKR